MRECGVIGSCERVVAFCDNDASRWGTWLNGLRVLSPAELGSFPWECVRVSSCMYEEIVEQLVGLGVDIRKIEVSSPLVMSGTEKSRISRVPQWVSRMIFPRGRNMATCERGEIDREAVVYIGPWDWHRLRNRSQPLCEALARIGYDVYYLNPEEKKLDRLTPMQRFCRRLITVPYGRVAFVGADGAVTVIDVESLGRIDRRSLAWDYSPQGRDVLSLFLLSLRKRYRRLRLVMSRQLRCSVMGAVAWDHVTLDIEDPWPESVWAQDSYAKFAIRKAMACADLVTGNGAKISACAVAAYGKRVVSMVNGVDRQFLENAWRGDLKIPQCYSIGEGRFRVLFCGVIDGRIHYDVLAEALPKIKEVDFFFVGGLYVPNEHMKNWDALMASGNCHHIGPVPYADLPCYIYNSHGLLLPYSNNGGDKMFPAKLMEYLSSAKIVFTSLDHIEIAPVADLLRFYKDSDGLRAHLDRAVSDSFAVPDHLARKVREFCLINTWDDRAKELSRWWADGPETESDELS